MFNFFGSKQKGQANLAEKDSANKIFILGSYESTLFAFSLIDNLKNYNESNSLLFKTYKALNCHKDDFIRSFYLLQDVVLFCEKDPLFGNNELTDNIRFLYSQEITYFLDVPIESIPTDKKQNSSFGRQFKLLENLGPKELEDLTLVNWRNSEQWMYWANEYGSNELGDYCRKMAERPL